MRVGRKRFSCHFFHASQGILQLRVRRAMNRHYCAKTMRFDRERQIIFCPVAFRSQFHTVIQVEVARAVIRPDRHFMAGFVILIAIDDSPDGAITDGPAARKNTIEMHRIERLPAWAGEERSHRALNSRRAAHCLSVARSHAIPDTPNIFPALPSLAVEECELQVVRLVAIPAALDVDLVLWLKPAVPINGGHKLELVLAP